MLIRNGVLAALGIMVAAGFSSLASAGQPLCDAQLPQGPWAGVYCEKDGRQMSPDNARDLHLTVEQNCFLLSYRDDFNAIAWYALDNRAFGRCQIDLVVLGGPDAGQIYSGVCSLNGNIMEMCFAPAGLPRPTEFYTLPDTGQILYTWIQAQRQPN